MKLRGRHIAGGACVVGGRASHGCCVLTRVAMPGTLRVPCRCDHA